MAVRPQKVASAQFHFPASSSFLKEAGKSFCVFLNQYILPSHLVVHFPALQSAVSFIVGQNGGDPQNAGKIVHLPQLLFAPSPERQLQKQVCGASKAKLFDPLCTADAGSISHFCTQDDLRDVRCALFFDLGLQTLPGSLPTGKEDLHRFYRVIMGRGKNRPYPLGIRKAQSLYGLLRGLTAVVHSGQDMAMEITKSIHLFFPFPTFL